MLAWKNRRKTLQEEEKPFLITQAPIINFVSLLNKYNVTKFYLLYSENRMIYSSIQRKSNIFLCQWKVISGLFPSLLNCVLWVLYVLTCFACFACIACLRALRASKICVPFVLTCFACLRALRVYVSACLRALHAYVPPKFACLRALRVFVLCVPPKFACLRALR